MQTLLLLDSEIYSSDRFTFLTRSTRSQFSLSIAFKLKSRRHFPIYVCRLQKFPFIPYCISHFYFCFDRGCWFGFFLVAAFVLTTRTLSWFPILTARVDKTVAPRFVLLFFHYLFSFFGLFISARLECVGVAAGDVGRIGFGFVLCANWKRWQYYQSFSVYTSVGLMV